MKTTLYNHAELGTTEKPIIPNLEYKGLIEALQAGNKEVLDKALEKWTLEFNQQRIAEALQREING